MSKRKIHITNEARVLRLLREEAGLSMRQAGELCGKSGSYVSQIENGRMRVPVEADLQRLLEVYGKPSMEEFLSRVQCHRHRMSEREEIAELLPKLRPTETTMILKIIQAIVA